ncbi:hypothetical protein HO133_002379 [Letharia lupina]|uniref:DH domain-containing protein n=1 Tax=Letharia lupina TaxID=560253 RepID=A0A8H6FB85_9LECA|nr:uncharacterized protein HO133_002379 [Letharia lupina]KAF6221523.1 hypothetical protein HO133_002379 [Letharia lupina]
MASLQARGHMNGSSTLSASSDQRGLFPAAVPSTFSPPPPDVFPKMGSNIMNIKAGANSSLYQICTGLRQRLGDVPGFEDHIIEMEEEEEDSADEPKDPVTLMWNCLRRGYPLMTIYNASSPERPLKFDATKIREDKVGKATTFKFLQACMTDLKIPPHECFLITDLFGEDTTGFVKVTKLVNRVLDILDTRGFLRHNEQPTKAAVAESAPTSYKAHVIEELLMTERNYIQHLEILQEFKRQVTGGIAGDAIHDIFLNLNQLLDFQRRFLVRIEQQNRLSESEQNWGKLFSYYRESFRVYEPFIANQNRCNETVLSVWPKLKKADLSNELRGIVETPSVLLSFLIKPFQRLSKYPLLLAELRTKGGLDLEKQEDLEEGEAAARSIMTRADEAVQKEHHAAAVNELQSRVEDWKGHKINHFGELLHFGNYTVLKGEGAKVVEREVSVIFDSLDPVTRAMVFSLFMRSLHRGTSKPPRPRSWTSALQFLNRNPRGKHVSDLASVPEHSVEEHRPVPVTPKTPPRRSMFLLRRKTPPACPQILSQAPSQIPVEPPSWSPFRFHFKRRKGPTRGMLGTPPSRISSDAEPPMKTKPPEEQAIEIFQNALQILKIGTEPELATSEGMNRAPTSESSTDDAYRRIMDWSHNTPFHTKASKAYPPKALTPLQFLLLKSIREARHLYKLDGAFKNTTLFLFSNSQLPDPILSLAARAAAATATATAEPVLGIKPMSDLEKQVADDLAIESLVREQYKVYLFERILLCCKEINPNKPKNKMLAGKQPLVDRKGKLKLQLKGRIFMQNVTDVVTLNQGQYTLQIFWKGDPGVENFVIRFPDEAQMIKWRDTVQAQKKSLCDQARNSGQTGTSATEFNYMKDQVLSKNPYQEDEDMEEEEIISQIVGPTQSSFTVSRNPSSNSLRSIAGPTRMAPPKFPLAEHGNGMYAPPLSLNTNVPPGTAASPGEFPGNSYFSPTNDSPTSTRSTSQQSFSQFTRQQTVAGHWPHEENKHRTAPAMGRAPSREGPAPPNSYVVNGRTVTRPSLPVMAASQNPQQSRLRSASTPDIHNLNAPGARRQGASHLPTQAENVPMPPIPSHMVQGRAPLNRSQTSSPVESQLPIRSATQSPSVHRDRAHRQYQEPIGYDRQGQRLQQSFESETRDYHHGHYAEEPTQLTPQNTETSSSANSIMDYPNQLKVRVRFDPEPSHVTIVVPTFIKHRSLTDRIDSKMAKVTAASIAKKTARLRYEDSDGDMVRIETDEDVHLAIEDWATQNERQILEGPAPDFELQWQQN